MMLNRCCDMCGKPAVVDTKTIYGYWAYLCEEHNQMYGTKAFQTRLDSLSEGDTTVKLKLSGKMVEIPIEPKER